MNYPSMYNKILENNRALEKEKVKKVLILYEEKVFFIGDTCLRFDKFKIVRRFFESAVIHLNLTNSGDYIRYYNAILQNNPHVDERHYLSWQEIDFLQYDVVVCIIPQEEELMGIFHERYSGGPGRFHPAVFSLSSIYINSGQANNIFPRYEEIIEFFSLLPDKNRHELYISAEERRQADAFLQSKGIKKGEELFIMLDSSAKREKLLRMDVYFDTLTALLQRRDLKVLIFDEKGIGKEGFYREWLPGHLMKKIIFSRQLPFREELGLLASTYTRLIFGPCTGLLHCAAGIYNHFLKNGLPAEKVPLLITYTGQYEREGENAQAWWGDCPLVDCLLIKNLEGKPKAYLLSELSEYEKVNTGNVLKCKDYRSDMITGFINARLERKTAFFI